MQAKLSNKGFSSTTSGKLNEQSNRYKHKIIDLDDFDVQMLSPEFLMQKTLKKPIKESDIHLRRTNQTGVSSISTHKQKFQDLKIEDLSHNKTQQLKNQRYRVSETPQSSYQYIQAKGLAIKPAYQVNNLVEPLSQNTQNTQVSFKDKNSIISAMLKKTEKPEFVQIKVTSPKATSKPEGPAQRKLKEMFGKQAEKMSIKKKERLAVQEQIEEEVIESIQEDYGNQQFEKMSGAYDSAIKQSIRESIRESIGGSSEAIKQSIKEDIPQLMSYQDSFKKSQESIKEEVPESYSDSFKKRNQISEQIEQDVYQQIFEDMSASDELSKSKNSPFKRSKEYDEKFDLSASASKGFRTKKSVVKSIKLAEEFNPDKKGVNIQDFTQKIINKNPKITEALIKEKQRANELTKKISNILKEKKHFNKPFQQVNKDLLFQFKVQINRLITSQNFTSKLRKITSFLIGASSNKSYDSIESLENKIVDNFMMNLESLKKSQIQRSEMDQFKNDYDTKLQTLLKDQEIRLRVEMDKKIHQKDVEYREMIAVLEQKLSQGVRFIGQQPGKPLGNAFSGQIEVDSDYSIDSDDISWKQDLWQLLPDYEKRKLYEKQSSQIANFLTDILVKQVREQSLDRSGCDLSFEFPDDLNISSSFESSFPEFKKKKMSTQQPEIFKPAINRQELKQSLKDQKQELFPPLKGMIRQPPKHEIPNQVDISNGKADKDEQNQKRNTTSSAQVVKILSKYKAMYLKKKNDTIRKIIKTLQMKPKSDEPLCSYIADIKILYDRQISIEDLAYVRAYQEELIMELTGFYTKHQNRKYNSIEQGMRKLYDRLVVTCQIKAAQASVELPKQIVPDENYVELRMTQEEKQVKNDIVGEIMNILSLEFAREIPVKKRK